MEKQSNKVLPRSEFRTRLPKHEYVVDDDGGRQMSDDQMRQEFEEWVAHCESNQTNERN